ncbi:MAG: signal peptidase II [Candidatus Altimarinota bacterium]
MIKNLSHLNPSLNLRTFFQVIVLASVFLFFDQLIKIWASNTLSSPIQITDFFQLTLERNYGIAFSFALPYPLLLALNTSIFLILIVFFFYHFNLSKWFSTLLLASFIGGALGNLFDRFTLGFVIDYLAFWSFPVFNLADILITCSIFLITVFYGRIERTK